jgi:hypothetical protein
MFPQIMVLLRLAELLLLALAIFLAVHRREYLLIGVALLTSLIAPSSIRRHAYNTELRRMANFQVEANHMDWQQALEVAKIMLDMEIRDGRRVG